MCDFSGAMLYGRLEMTNLNVSIIRVSMVREK